jgi:hypothetical protein
VKKLERIKELVLKEGCKLSRLKKHGFVRLKANKSSSSGHVYINHKKGVVVKRPYLTHDEIPAAACPTIRIDSPEPYWGQLNIIYIQPLCRTDNDNRWAAFSILNEREMRGDRSAGADLKEANCGMYKRKPVVFDW